MKLITLEIPVEEKLITDPLFVKNNTNLILQGASNTEWQIILPTHCRKESDYIKSIIAYKKKAKILAL